MKNVNCTYLNTRFEEYLEGKTSSQEMQLIERHVASCDSCRVSMNKLMVMRRLAKKLPVIESDVDFEERVFAEVRKRYSLNFDNRFTAGFVVAMAASFILWVASIVMFPQSVISEPQVVSVALNNAHSIKLLFNSPSDFEQVTVSIDLPDNFELDGYPGYKQLSWKTSLKQGQTILTLPVMAVDPGTGELTTQLSYGNKMKTYIVKLESSVDGAVSYQIQAVKSV